MTYRVQRTCTRLADGRELICFERMQGSFQTAGRRSRHQAPVRAGADRDDFWLHRQISSIHRAVGKLKYLAGSGWVPGSAL